MSNDQFWIDRVVELDAQIDRLRSGIKRQGLALEILANPLAWNHSIGYDCANSFTWRGRQYGVDDPIAFARAAMGQNEEGNP